MQEEIEEKEFINKIKGNNTNEIKKLDDLINKLEIRDLLEDLQKCIDDGQYEQTLKIEHIKLLLDYITNLQNKLQQKEKIIKEVREEVKEARLWNWTEQKILIDKFTKRLLEILDKVEEKNNE